jgi:hypothetical protein
MNMSELQSQIDSTLNQLGTTEITRIQLSAGSDVIDLASRVDVDVTIGHEHRRTFSIVANHFFDRLFSESSKWKQFLGADAHFFTSGGPLSVAKEISGEIIVRGILKFVRMEQAREW